MPEQIERQVLWFGLHKEQYFQLLPGILAKAWSCKLTI
jgi:hypothetical protein